MAKQEAKVFIGGLSWETTDEKLRTYFENYGNVNEAFVSYDRHTGRPRGFGFVVFADSVVADKVIGLQHTIDRREVEAKRALPKDESPVSKDQQAAGNGQRTRKIFVGGLAPTVDEPSFRAYFADFGTVDDAVVMYDYENKRPRGFGFITFTEEDAVEKVFARGTIQTIHDKQIEIKRAVPRDSMPPSPRAMYRQQQHPQPQHHHPMASPPHHYERTPELHWPRGPTPPQQQQHAYTRGGAGGGYGTPHRGGGGGGPGGGYPQAPPMHVYGPRSGSGGMRSPPHHGMGIVNPMGMYSPPAVVTGIPANMAHTPEGAAALASGAGVLPMGAGMGTPLGVMTPAPLAVSAPLQAQGHALVQGALAMPNGMQSAAQLGSPPGPTFSLAEAQQQVAAQQQLADLQRTQAQLTTTLGQLQQAQQAQQQQQQAQAAIWS